MTSRRNFIKTLGASAAAVYTGASFNSYSHVLTASKKRPASQSGFNHSFFKNAKPPEVIAHRGGDGEVPGETMMAMQHAFDLNVDVLEMDVYLTKDNELVLMHDILVSRATEVNGPIRKFFNVHQFTLSELQHLNAGYHWAKKENPDCKIFRKKFSELLEDCKDRLRVPTLREVFDAFPHIRMNIEMKPAFVSPVDALISLIKEKKMTENVLVASFWHPYLEKFRCRYPDVATSASAVELIQYITEGKRPNADAIQVKPQITAELKKREIIRWSILTDKFVKRCHNDNFPVHAWTINKDEEMRRLTDPDLRIDGIITDCPTDLLKILGRPVP